MRLARLFLTAATGTAGEFRITSALMMIAMVIGIVLLPARINRALATIASIGSDGVGSSSCVSLLPDGGQRTSPDNDAVVQPAHGSWPIAPFLITRSETQNTKVTR